MSRHSDKWAPSSVRRSCSPWRRRRSRLPRSKKKTLPPPEDKPRAKRGGKRHRRIKEKYGQSEFRKLINRVKFGHEPEDNIYTEDWGLGVPFFEGKPMPLKTQKVSKEKQLHSTSRRRRDSAPQLQLGTKVVSAAP